jgi:NADH dehydrogenase
LPARAPVAIQEGRAVAENLARALLGQPLQPFRYRNLGNLVILGRYAGVADILGVRFAGFPAWFAWRLLHLLWLGGLSNKLAVLLDWATLQFGSRETALLEAN